jgi:hypothetical protein
MEGGIRVSEALKWTQGKGVQELLELSFDDHLSVETDVRLDLYVENVEKLIFLGEINVRDQGKLDEIKQRFRIVPEEAAKLEPYILSSIQRLAVKGKILLVDDDARCLAIPRRRLQRIRIQCHRKGRCSICAGSHSGTGFCPSR